MDENELNLLLQVRLCRFCVQPSTASAPFIAACICMGPNSCIHATCLEEYLENHPKQKRCDVCCIEYKTNLSPRTTIDWLNSSHVWEHSDLPKLLELTSRGLNNIWNLVFSASLIGYTPLLDQIDEPYWFMLQTFLGRLILAFGAFRVFWVWYAIVLSLNSTRAQFNTWRDNNPKVTVEPIANYTPLKSQFGRSAARASGLKPKKLLNPMAVTQYSLPPENVPQIAEPTKTMPTNGAAKKEQ